MTQPLYKTLLKRAARHGQSDTLDAATQRAALFERFAKDAARKLQCKATDQPATHYATLALALELIQTRLIGGKEIDVSSLRWLSEQLDRYQPPPEIPRVDIQLVETIAERCPQCGYERDSGRSKDEPDPPPHDPPSTPPTPPTETKPSCPVPAVSNVVELPRRSGIHDDKEGLSCLKN
jgi:hypothetical protein